jgi:hypothetical protein
MLRPVMSAEAALRAVTHIDSLFAEVWYNFGSVAQRVRVHQMRCARNSWHQKSLRPKDLIGGTKTRVRDRLHHSL